MDESIPQTKFQFSEGCIENCPLVHKAVCTALARLALTGNNLNIERREIAAEIDETFRHPLGFGYNVECSGPKQAYSGQGLRCGRQMHSRGGV